MGLPRHRAEEAILNPGSPAPSGLCPGSAGHGICLERFYSYSPSPYRTSWTYTAHLLMAVGEFHYAILFFYSIQCDQKNTSKSSPGYVMYVHNYFPHFFNLNLTVVLLSNFLTRLLGGGRRTPKM
jgi:hypothetical protein